MSVPNEAIWSVLPMPAVVLDESDSIVHLNPAAEDFINASEKTLIGLSAWEKVNVKPPFSNALARVREGSAPLYATDIEIQVGHKGTVQCDLQIVPFADASGHLLVLISPKRAAGHAATSRIARSAAKSAIGMAEMLAHEIKNPLAGITGAAQLLEMNLPAEDQEMTELIVSECRRIVGLLDQVEQFGDLSGPNLKASNVHDVLDRARQSASVGFARHMQINGDYDPSLPLVSADADQLLQVLQNLLKNASEAADPAGGVIRLRSYYDHGLRLHDSETGGRAVPVQIEIEDDGPGLPAEIADDIFEPFISGRENGTGLGLALVAKIISDHGGGISVESRPGRTLFRISLPLAPKDLSEE
ncbi:Nitrogen regulation protein NR(II) [Roseovarius albus]|uniref:histidine kinase n=1 Tax=Roseovarius albus TaxID=1247867 RepID=A0A1X6Z0D5_9RHOB|nr:ATP-binding protein [Roseovarius albus]SLN37039.1 Nitrogen regulation protein NR(II) [Roseovarius albus]